MIRITDKSKCCGCSACASVCIRNAIRMQPDDLGFPYPTVDTEKCNDCGLCEKVCTFHPGYSKKENLETSLVYAVRHKKIKEIETSRSGAMFIALSDWILDHGGVVYGAGYADHFRVVHKRATTKEERNEFKGSKYVQSDMNDVFKRIKVDLKAGLKVLFSGTPCQTSGLRASLLKTDMTNLYLCDIVCHGVPSPRFWKDYLALIEKKQKNTVIKVDFRDKNRFGWKAHKESFTFTNNQSYTYDYKFYKDLMFRNSCAVCPFTNFQRPSDITIGDFWGWQKAVGEEFGKDDKGVSLILVNSEKGKAWFETVKSDINYIETNTESCLQPNLQHPSVIHPERNNFERDYCEKGFEYVLNKYCKDPSKTFLVRVKKSMKNRIKKLIGK